MAASVLILPSPLLPTVAYAPLSEALRGAGLAPVVADPSPARATGRSVDALVEQWVQDAQGSELLVAHSNAGLTAPVVRSRAGTGARIVFLDAALLPEAGRAPLAPAPLRDGLASRADERGMLPPWTRWWPGDTLRTVVPEHLVDTIDRACPRLPLAYFDQHVEAPPGWTGAANAYLSFGDTYAGQLRFAGDHAWPTDRVDGGHLHFLHQPELVADRIVALAHLLG